MKQPDLGTSLLVMAAGLAVIFFAGLPWRLMPADCRRRGLVLIVHYEPQLCAEGARSVLREYQQQRVHCSIPTRDRWARAFTSSA